MSALLFVLAAVAGQAQITFTSVTHDFNQVLDGQTFAYGVEMTNVSSSAFAFALTLAGSSEFTVADGCGSSVAAGANCEIVFTFAPKTAGAVSATWSLAAHGETFSPSNGGTLSGTGVIAPAFSITSAAHNFETAPVHIATPAYGVVLYNSTVDPINLTITTPKKNGVDFPVTENNCPAQMLASTECEIAWEFDPTAAGTITANYKISGVDATTGATLLLSDPEKKSVTAVDLTGTGTDLSGVVLTTAGHTFADQGVKTVSPTYGVVLTNATANTISLTYTGSGSTASFPSQGNNCGATLLPAAICEMQWAFDPQAVGEVQMNYAVAATSGGAPVTITSGGQTATGVALTGTGVTGTLGLSVSSNNFGAWEEEHTSPAFLTVLSNTTIYEVDLTYATTGTPADFPQTEDTCGATLAANASCNLQWTFDPQAAGSLSSAFDIKASLPTGDIPLSVTSGTKTVNGVSLSGYAEAAAGVFLDTASNAFGELGVGGVSDTYSPNLYNTTSSVVDLSYAYSNATSAKNFTITSKGCGATLAANSTCGITWEFTPVVAGVSTVVYDITATEGGAPVTITSGGAAVSGVSLRGTGVE